MQHDDLPMQSHNNNSEASSTIDQRDSEASKSRDKSRSRNDYEEGTREVGETSTLTQRVSDSAPSQFLATMHQTSVRRVGLTFPNLPLLTALLFLFLTAPTSLFSTQTLNNYTKTGPSFASTPYKTPRICSSPPHHPFHSFVRSLRSFVLFFFPLVL